MSSKTTLAEISPPEFGRFFSEGMSMAENATRKGRTYSFVRNSLIEYGVGLRTKAEGTRASVSRHPRFTGQIGSLLASIGIDYHPSKLGVIINKKSQITRFFEMVGFSPGMNVVRKKAGESIWFGFEKAGLQRLSFRISKEQGRARHAGLGGCFADCSTRDITLQRLRKWYAEVNGGGTT